jgi:predicted amidohydrolase
MQVDIAQMDVELGEKRTNTHKALDIIAKSTADLILFPELFTTGLAFDHLSELAETLDGETVNALSDACENRMAAGSIIETDGKWLYNTFLLIDDTGIIGKYRKIHLFHDEKHHFASGEKTCVVNTKFGRIGLATCYDVRFPEMFRRMMEEEADFILLCANFPKVRRTHWEVLVKARAIENQYYVVACNRVGRDLKQEYHGRSMAVDPLGNVLTVGEDREEVLRCTVDRKNVKEARSSFPVLSDIRLR